MSKLFGKRGAFNTVVNWIIQLAIPGLFLLTMLGWISETASNDLFERNYLARDLALVVDTIYASPGNVKVVYPTLSRGYTLEFTHNRVDVYDQTVDINPPLFRRGIYIYAEDLNIPIQPVVLAPDIDFEVGEAPTQEDYVQPIFYKDSEKMVVSNEALDTPENLFLNCPFVDTKDEAWLTNKKIYIDPGHGENYEPAKEWQNARIIADGINMLSTNIYSTKGSFDNTEDIPLSQRISASQNADILISLHMADEHFSKNDMKAYVSAQSGFRDESVKLGCLIINKLIPRLNQKFTSFTIIPVTPSHSDPHTAILKVNKPAVVLELGNVQSPAELSEQDLSFIADSIFEALGDYFE